MSKLNFLLSDAAEININSLLRNTHLIVTKDDSEINET